MIKYFFKFGFYNKNKTFINILSQQPTTLFHICSYFIVAAYFYLFIVLYFLCWILLCCKFASLFLIFILFFNNSLNACIYSMWILKFFMFGNFYPFHTHVKIKDKINNARKKQDKNSI